MQLFKKIPVLSISLMVLAYGSLAQASTVDLSTFTKNVGTNSSIAVTSTQALLTGTTTLSGTVSNLKSFQWEFTSGDGFPFNDFSYATISKNTNIALGDVFTTGDTPASTGWLTYIFSKAYTGAITFGVANDIDDNFSSSLSLRNLITMAPVPEPETYLLHIAGLGLLGAVARSRKSRLDARTKASLSTT